MATINQYKGWFPIVSAVLLLSFWVLFALFLPMNQAYLNWVLNKHWTWINGVGFLGSLSGFLAVNALFQYKGYSAKWDYIIYCVVQIGIISLTSLLFFEAFILKGIAKISPELIVLNQGFYKESAFRWANLIGGIFFSSGMVLMSISMLKKTSFKPWKLVLLILGAPLFGIVWMPGNLRILGVLLFSISYMAIGVEMLKVEKEKKRTTH
ncbi:MAG: hypothetical protein OEY34_06515 [Cyclobacteriaceae bacterium]|nr:hypothetical protein [Cyclobacteriaceae bacterium]